MMKRRIRWRIALLATASLAVVASGCGDDEGEESSGDSAATEAAVEEVTLTADDRDGYTFELSETPTADTTSVVFDNQGKEGHFLVYAKINEGFTVDEAVELQGKKGSAEILVEKGAGPGQSKTFEISDPVEPGNYAMLCPIPAPEGPHYKLGQLEEFEIG